MYRDDPNLNQEAYHPEHIAEVLTDMRKSLPRYFESFAIGQKPLDETLNCTDLNKVDKFTIVDQRVFNESEENIALSKHDFARYVLSNAAGYDDFGLSSFVILFQLIEEILREVTNSVSG